MLSRSQPRAVAAVLLPAFSPAHCTTSTALHSSTALSLRSRSASASCNLATTAATVSPVKGSLPTTTTTSFITTPFSLPFSSSFVSTPALCDHRHPSPSHRLLSTTRKFSTSPITNMSATPPPSESDPSATATATVTASEQTPTFVPPFEQDSNLPDMDPLTLPDTFPIPPPLSVLGHSLPLVRRSAWDAFLLRFRLFKQLRGRVRKGTVLTLRVSGALPERVSMTNRLLSSTPSEVKFSALLDALRCGAHDPRIAHLHVRVDTLTCGWGKLLELRRHLDMFAQSGKGITAYIEAGGMKEFFLVAGFTLYVPPQGDLSLRGFSASGAFLRGVLDNVGVDPQTERIGAYKSAGDQLMRSSMSEEQREVLNAILSDVSHVFNTGVCEATGIEKDALVSLLDSAPYDMQQLVDAGLIKDIAYESQVIDALKIRFAPKSPFGGSPDAKELVKKPLQAIELPRYARRATPRLLGLSGRKKIAVIRAIGAITPGKNGSSPVSGASVGSDTLIQLLRRARDDKRVAGVVLRIDSPGGSALASDIIWHEIRSLRSVKPVVASQGDVAASGGYYLSMATGDIVSEALTLTGSVGVVASKPSLKELYERVGYTKENVSTGGKYAELLVDDRPFNEDEKQYFVDIVKFIYRKFVSKAAQSRGKTYDDMDKVAQGRVWTGKQAKENGLVDHIGGIGKAIEVVKMRCDIPPEQKVKVEEIKPLPSSLAERIGLVGAGAIIPGLEQEEMSPAERLLTGNNASPLAIADIVTDETGLTPLAKLTADVAAAKLGAMASVVGGGEIGKAGALQKIVERIAVTVMTSGKN